MVSTSSVQKKWRLFRAWAGLHPVWCAWQVTYRCNFRCRMCNYWARGNNPAAEPSVDTYRVGSRKLAKLGSLLVSLAGGEPLLRPDIAEIVETVAEFHFPFLTTNGFLATRELANDLMSNGLWGVSVSIDYADPARHDRRRGMVGAWENAWRAVEYFASARKHPWQRVNVIAVLMEDNLDEIEPLLKMAARYKSYFMVQPYGQLKTGSDAFVHKHGPASPRLVELRHKYPNFLSNPTYLGSFDRYMKEGVPGCKAGRAFFNIDETGEVAICVEHRQQPVGNLYQDDMTVLSHRLRRASRGNQCRKCWYNCRGEVEMLYHPTGIFKSLPTLFLDRGKARSVAEFAPSPALAALPPARAER